jgi:RNA polymerase sigma factor (sigma-70 family)
MGQSGRIRLVPPRMLSDEALVEAVRAGDRRAFEVLFDRYHRRLLSFCRHMLAAREEAEDAVQQTFLAAYRDLRASTKAIRLRPWLYTIARNQCLLVLRRRRERVGIEELEPATEGLSAEVQRREELREMLVDVSHLPEDQRAALLLAELGDLSHPEIARVVGCRRQKVKALVFQARESLTTSRAARETPCSEVRAQLATLKGGGLRRTGLRRHVSECAACRSFEAEVKRQRQALAVVLPVAPMAALKPSVLAGIGLHAGGAASAGGGAAAAGAASTTAGGLIPVKLLGIGVVLMTLGVGAVLLETADRSVPPRAQAADLPSWVLGRPARAQSALRAAADQLVSKAAGLLSPTTPRFAGRVQVKGESRTSPAVSSPGYGVGGDTSQRDGGGSGDGGSSGNGGNGKHKADSGSGNGSVGRGRSDQAPGRRGTTPGQAGTTPGQSDRTPAHGEPPPGQADTSPGKSDDTPGKSGDTPGKSGGGKSGSGKSGRGKRN